MDFTLDLKTWYGNPETKFRRFGTPPIILPNRPSRNTVKFMLIPTNTAVGTVTKMILPKYKIIHILIPIQNFEITKMRVIYYLYYSLLLISYIVDRILLTQIKLISFLFFCQISILYLVSLQPSILFTMFYRVVFFFEERTWFICLNWGCSYSVRIQFTLFSLYYLFIIFSYMLN